MGLSWLLLAIAVGFHPTEFRLDTDTPDALCPEIAMTRDTVRKRLGSLDVDGGGTWRGRYSTVHDPTGRRGDYVRLVIIDPAGVEKAVRELPIRGESCATVAQAIALVVDGFFRDLGQAASNDGAPPSPNASQPPEATARTNSEALPVPVQVTKTPPQSEPVSARQAVAKPNPSSAFGFSVAGGYEFVPGSASGSLGLFAAVTPVWRIDLRFAVPVSDQQYELRGGKAHLRLFPLRTALTYEGAVWDRLRLFVGPELLVSFEQATTSQVEAGKSGWRAAFGSGIRGGVAYSVLPRITLAAGLSADYILLESRRVLLEGDSELEPERARLAGMLELWGEIFP